MVAHLIEKHRKFAIQSIINTLLLSYQCLQKKKLINNSHMLTHSHALNRKASVNNSGLLKKLTYVSIKTQAYQ